MKLISLFAGMCSLRQTGSLEVWCRLAGRPLAFQLEMLVCYTGGRHVDKSRVAPGHTKVQRSMICGYTELEENRWQRNERLSTLCSCKCTTAPSPAACPKNLDMRPDLLVWLRPCLLLR